VAVVPVVDLFEGALLVLLLRPGPVGWESEGEDEWAIGECCLAASTRTLFAPPRYLILCQLHLDDIASGHVLP
jgi:hypothetical protein